MLSLGLAGALAPQDATAQVVRERQVPLDTAGTVLEIGPELRRDLDLFPGVQGFDMARLFEGPGGSLVLEISLRGPEGALIRERRTLSDVEVADLRARVSSALGARGPAVSREGRAGLVLTATGLGLGFYGWAVPVALDLEDRSAVAAYLLTAGASFLVPYRLTAGRPVSRTRRNAAAWGATRGIAYGLALGDALTGGEEPGDDLDDQDEKVTLAAGIATSLLGGVLGYAWGGRPGLDEGAVALQATAGDFALAYGFGTSVALGLYDGKTHCELDFCSRDDLQRRPAGHLASMGLAAAGTWAAGRWVRARRHTLGNTRAIRSFGLLGAQAVLPLAWAAFEDKDNGERPLAATLVLGSAAGLLAGDHLLRERHLSSGEGLLVMAGHAAGGLGALGLTYLADGSSDFDTVVYLATSAVGSLAGTWLTLRAVGDDDVVRRGADDDGPSVHMEPWGPVLATLLASPSSETQTAPWVTVRF